MACFFSAEDLAALKQGRNEVQTQFADLREQYFFREYRSKRGREFANEGFCRRLDTLVRAINFVFELLPPELETISDHDEVVAATIIIQSFVFNAFGCLDNLAWIWVYEKGLKGKDGKAIKPDWVGLGPRYRYVRRSFSAEFRGYLKSRKKWFEHLAGFRDSLAHRIPLYIPPYVVSSANMDEYRRIERESFEARGRGDNDEYDRLQAAQKKLGRFMPWMTHSQFEDSPAAVFHWQLLQDYVTIDEFGREMLAELDRLDKTKPADGSEGTFWLNSAIIQMLKRLCLWRRSDP